MYGFRTVHSSLFIAIRISGKDDWRYQFIFTVRSFISLRSVDTFTVYCHRGDVDRWCEQSSSSKLMIMQIVQRDFHEKRNTTLTSFVRNTSCSRGWLRLLVQITFGVITVVSFILIVHMAYRSPNNRPPKESRCVVNGCRIVCREAPFFDKYEEDVIDSVNEAEVNCKRMFLTLYSPVFANSTMPINWLSNMRSNIQTFTISGGNLKHIPPYAFMSPFAYKVKSLFLTDITLESWLPETFIGLSNLEELYLRDTKLVTIHTSALLTIDDTLKTLDIKATNIWNPTYITGSANPVKLTTVDFSRNVFLDTLDGTSFFMIQNCKRLYLSFCQITSIPKGTLDRLKNIEILFLDNNFIHQVPDGLFNVLLGLPHKPRINLQDNPWICDCSNTDLRNLHNFDLLIVQPSCYYPIELRGLKFFQFEDYCTNNNSESALKFSNEDVSENKKDHARNETLNIKTQKICKRDSKINSNNFFTVISPFKKYRCLGNRINNYELIESKTDLFTKGSSWFKPVYYSQSEPYSIVEIASLGPSSYGLLWFRSSCPNEVYCISKLPKLLRVYEVTVNAHYTFCPYGNGTILLEECVAYNLTINDSPFRKLYTYLLYITIAFVCLSSGALCVYGLIRKNPVLLKGSKRVLFVKHKQVDALVLPPKIPMRNNLIKDDFLSESDKRNIFIVSPNLPLKFTRMNSTRSNNSVPSYISAIQPSEDQLAQWRRKHHNDKNSTVRSTNSSMSTVSWIYDDDTIPYFQLDSKEPIYEHII